MVTLTSANRRFLSALFLFSSLFLGIQAQIGFGDNVSGNGNRGNNGNRGSGVGDDISFGSGGGSKSEESRVDDALTSVLGTPDPVSTRLGPSTKLAGSGCTDPEGNGGFCRVHRRCRNFRQRVINDLNANRGRPSRALINYVNQAVRSPCGFDNNLREWTVCCASSRATTTTTTRRPSQSNRCGVSSRGGNTLRIVNGQESIPGAWRWAAILGERRGSSGIRVICGGTLINERHVLSAAHCEKALPGTSTLVRLGEHDINRSSDGAHRDFTVERLISHRSYSERSLKNDIMIVRLRNRVTFSDRIGPICLPRSGFNPEREVRDDPIVIGWGSTVTGGSTVSALREAFIGLVTRTNCDRAYNSIERIRIGTDQLCAGDGSTDTCTGDSGGPMMTEDGDGNWVVIGVTSFGVECNRSDFPGVYTRVDQFLSWIRQNTRA